MKKYNKNILHFTNNDFDGAGRAVIRLQRGLLQSGIDSIVYVLHTTGNNKKVKLLGWKKNKNISLFLRYFCSLIINKLLYYYWKPKSLFNFGHSRVTYQEILSVVSDNDTIIIHNTYDFLIPQFILKLFNDRNIKIIMHPLDMEMITGGCHFNFDCECYEISCGYCPQLKKYSKNDPSSYHLNTKKEIYKNIPLTWIVANNFVLQRLKNSAVYSNLHCASIAYMGIEPERYKDIAAHSAKKHFNFPIDKKIILFGCFDLSDKRKGAYVLKKIINSYVIVKDNLPKFELVTFGSKNGFRFDNVGFSWTHLGHISTSEEMNLLYRASDLLVSPSLDDTGPTILQEAFMNHLPLVAFNIGIAQDIVIDNVNGRLVSCYDNEQFGNAIYDILSENININYSCELIQELLSKSTIEGEANAFVEKIFSK
jgi:glycosyltransferase involved in cell wall biosynthesis